VRGGGGGGGKGEKERHIVLIVLRLLSPIVGSLLTMFDLFLYTEDTEVVEKFSVS